MKGLIISVMAGIALITTAATYEGKIPAKGIAGPFEGTVETCELDSNKAFLLPSEPGKVIVAYNGNGNAKYTLVCED